MIVRWSRRLVERLRNKDYREAYVEENVRTGIAYQVRALRAQRGWPQKKLAEVSGKPQSVVSRLEDPDYGKLSVQTLLEIAAAFDVALLIQFVSFPEFLRRTRDVSPEGLQVESFDESQLCPAPSSTVWTADSHSQRGTDVVSRGGTSMVQLLTFPRNDNGATGMMVH